MLSNAAKNVVAKFAPKYKGLYEVIKITGSNLKILKDGKVHVVNVDQVSL